jgi:Fe-S cluster assembly iron-binding protein IscA
LSEIWTLERRQEVLMIQLTERAADGLKKILSAEGTPGDQGVKLVPDESGGVSMTIARPSQGDSVLDEGKRPLLIVDSMIAERLDGIVLDLSAEGPEAELRFVLRGTEPGSPPRSRES